MSLIGAAGISAAASLAGGFFSGKASSSANAANIEQARLDRQFQKEFAQQGIQWRTADAKAAGIHPLYAMGASIPGFTPSPARIGSANKLSGLAPAGQDISRAVMASASATTREEVTMNRLQLVNQSLQNDLLRQELLKTGLNQPQNPAMPNAMGTSTNLLPSGQASIKMIPNELMPSASRQPGVAAGGHPDISFVKTPEGNLVILPSKGSKELMEDQLVPEMMFAARNYGRGLLDPWSMDAPGRRPDPREWPLPPGFRWEYSHQIQAYEPVRRSQPSAWTKRQEDTFKFQERRKKYRGKLRSRAKSRRAHGAKTPQYFR